MSQLSLRGLLLMLGLGIGPGARADAPEAVGAAEAPPQAAAARAPGGAADVGVRVSGSRVALDVVDASLAQVLETLAAEAGVRLSWSGDRPSGSVSMRVPETTVRDAFARLLQGRSYVLVGKPDAPLQGPDLDQVIVLSSPPGGAPITVRPAPPEAEAREGLPPEIAEILPEDLRRALLEGQAGALLRGLGDAAKPVEQTDLEELIGAVKRRALEQGTSSPAPAGLEQLRQILGGGAGASAPSR